eukprot:Transcript_11143.p1 GENE.Transcript_11143~~Transcript_11143.p1  ORF type:complete len:693 (-),score=59.63 Transcript_11143:840-2717(-)
MAGPNNPFSLKWSMAQNNSYDYGLNGGIAFVFSPDFDTFCKQLLFKMPENDGAFQWARCEEMQNAVMRAMATWEANHQMIKFVDVTKACEREAEAYVSPAYGLPGNNARGKFPGKGTRGDMRFCKQAELVITSGAPDTPGSTVAAMVQHYSGDTPGRPDPGESSPPFGSPCEPDRQRCNALQSCREFAAQVCPDTCPDGGPCDCTCEGDYILNGGLDEGPQVPTFRYNSVGAVRQWQNPNNFGATGPMSTGGRLADPPCLERRLGEDSLEPPCLESILPTEDSKDYTVGKTTMHFHNHLCWYLDNTFCGSLHATYSTGFDVQTFMTILCFGITAIGLVMLGKHIMQALLNVSKHIRQHKNGMKKWHWWDVLEDTLIQLADCLSHNKLMLLMVITAPVIWSDVINLCFECYDFEAVVAHEIGHVLGFGHPDQYFMDNLKRPNADDYKQVPGFEAMSKDAQDKWKAFYAQADEESKMGPSTCGDAALKIPAFPADASWTVQTQEAAGRGAVPCVDLSAPHPQSPPTSPPPPGAGRRLSDNAPASATCDVQQVGSPPIHDQPTTISSCASPFPPAVLKRVQRRRELDYERQHGVQHEHRRGDRTGSRSTLRPRLPGLQTHQQGREHRE